MVLVVILFVLLFLGAFVFAELVLIIASWIARALGYIKGNQLDLDKKFAKISLWFAIAICMLIGYVLPLGGLIN
jgi:hypothetical protein